MIREIKDKFVVGFEKYFYKRHNIDVSRINNLLELYDYDRILAERIIRWIPKWKIDKNSTYILTLKKEQVLFNQDMLNYIENENTSKHRRERVFQ